MLVESRWRGWGKKGGVGTYMDQISRVVRVTVGRVRRFSIGV